MKTIVFLRGRLGWRQLRSSLKSPLEDIRFVGLEWDALEILRKEHLPVMAYKDYVSVDTAHDVDKFVEQLSFDWRRDVDGTDFTEFHGISLGKLFDAYFCDLEFQPAFRYQALAEAVISKENPSQVWCEGTSSGFLIDALQRIREIRKGSFEINIFGSPTNTCLDIREVMGPALAWRLEKATWGSRLVEWMTKGIFKVSSILDFFRRKRADRYRLLVSWHVSMRDLYRALMRSPWDRIFDVVMLEPPGRDLLGTTCFNGFHLLRWEKQGGVPKIGGALSEDDQFRVNKIMSTYKTLADDMQYQKRFDRSDHSPWIRLDSAIRRSFIEYLPKIARWVTFLEKYIRTNRIDAILVPIDSMPRQAAVVEVAKKSHLPNIVVLHGLPGLVSRNYFMSATMLALGGEEVKKFYMAQGRPPDSILTDCVSYLDHYVQGNPLISTNIKQSGQRVLVLTSAFLFSTCIASPEEPEEYLIQVLGVLKKISGLNVVVRPHPAESPEYYKSLLQGDIEYPVAASEEIDSLLNRHDIVIGPATTVLAQAAVLGKIVVCVNFTRCDYPPPFAPGNGFTFVSTSLALEVFLRGVVSSRTTFHQNHSDVLARFAGKLDGKSSDRLLGFVKDQCVGARTKQPSINP